MPPGLSEADRSSLASSFSGQLRTSLHDRLLYSTDASLYQVEPLAVVIPDSIDDARRALAACAARRLPILPRGGGTSLAGQCVNRAVVFDFSVHCRAVGPVDVARRRIRVEPGITLDELNEHIAARGHRLFFAPDVATGRHANLGGMIGNNSAGARSILYGRTAEHVLALDAACIDASGSVATHRFAPGAPRTDARVRDLSRAVLEIVSGCAGEIRARFPKTRRRVDGYNLDVILDQVEASRAAGRDPLDELNLTPLLVGSEGTLAVTLGAELNLEPLPAARGLAVVAFSTLDDAIAAVVPILATKPSAVELLDDTLIDLARQNTTQRPNVDLLPMPEGAPVGAVLYVEYSAFDSAAELPQRFADLRRVLGPRAAINSYTDPREMNRAWALRKAGEPLLHGLAGKRKPITFVEDTAVDPARLLAFVRDFRALIGRHGTRAAVYAHASVGCLHIRPLLDPSDARDRELMLHIAQEVVALVRRYDGALSGEHGDGRVRSPLLPAYFGPQIMAALRAVKRAFDPLNLLNPGNIADPGPVASIAASLRVLPEPARPAAVPPVDTFFDYADQHGFSGAVEMCNGAGVCRKKKGGVMCPSYMALLDERHSTRGRGNALRLAITGQLREHTGAAATATPQWDDPDTIETLNLCLSCKACKSECPSNVDVARLKAEYTAQRYRASRPPLAARLLSNVRALNRAASLAPSLANWAANTDASRLIARRLLNIDERRSLPPFAQALPRRLRRAGLAPRKNSDRPRLALFADCFTTYNEPAIGLAAVRLLSALGYDVDLLDTGCCQRPAISSGLLDRAIPAADAALARCARALDDGAAAILFLEPSCLSAVKDDWLSLKLSTPPASRARAAAASYLAEDFSEKQWGRHPRRPPLPDPGALPRRALFHAHCHQKALWGADTSAALLRRLLGPRLDVLDSTCCGMAGAFGLTADRYDLSMQIGELSVLPAARGCSPRDVFLATGTSCRHQIHDGAHRRALHPIELAASLLAPAPTNTDDPS